jgi:hypothetical protein
MRLIEQSFLRGIYFHIILIDQSDVEITPAGVECKPSETTHGDVCGTEISIADHPAGPAIRTVLAAPLSASAACQSPDNTQT